MGVVVVVFKSIYPKILIGLVLFDTVATFIFWSKGWMVEANPIMLYALQVGWLYWLIKALQVALVTLLGLWYTKMRVARVVVILGILVFSVAWLQFFIGSLIWI
jgi:hypothetical protein